jgi:hypothetical protein
MLSLSLLLILSQLLPYHLGNGAGEREHQVKTWDDFSWKYKRSLLQAKLESVGCYSAVLIVKAVILTNSVGDSCSEACRGVQSVCLQTMQAVFAPQTNRCVPISANLRDMTTAQPLEPLPDDSCHNIQCTCDMQISVSNILLSRPESNEEKMKRAKRKGATDHGLKSAPHNCNASGFAPWLKHKLREQALPSQIPPVHTIALTFEDVVLDYKCEAFHSKVPFPPETASLEGTRVLFEQAKKKINAENKESRDKKRAREAGSCPTSQSRVKSVRPPAQRRPVSLQPATCHVSQATPSKLQADPNEAAPSITQADPDWISKLRYEPNRGEQFGLDFTELLPPDPWWQEEGDEG